MEKILVVDDEKSMRDFLSIVLKKEGYAVSTADDGEMASRLVQKEIFDLVLTDVKMPKMSGLQVLKTVKETSPDTIVVMITAFASTETAIEAMKEGAYDYLTKPFQIEEVRLIIRNALEKKRLRTENQLLKKRVKGAAALEDIIGRSGGMQNVIQVIKKVANTQSNVLILGESGTGKELVAQAIHSDSLRKDKPFVTVNCSALPEPLLESELFGHMKGSFTGAHANKPGLFEIAHEGTIFLDESGDTPSGIQAKLLRVLEERAIERLDDLDETNYYLGLAYLKTGRERDGVARIEQALVINPRFRYGEPYLRLGEHYLTMGRYDDALAMLKQQGEIHTSSVEGLYQMGETYRRMGDPAQAREAYRRSLTAFRQSPRYKRRDERRWAWRARLALWRLG